MRYFTINKSFFSSRNTTILIGILYLFLIADAATLVLDKMSMAFSRASLIPRAIVYLFAIGYLIYSIKLKKPAAYLLFSAGFLISGFIIGFSVYRLSNDETNVIENIIIVNKYVFYFVIYAFLQIFIKDKSKYEMIFKAYEFVLIINFLCMVAGVLFGIDLFSSYGRLNRFGYKGLVNSINEATFFWFIGLHYGLFQYIVHHRKRIFLIALAANVIIGTKGGLLSVGIITIYLASRKRAFFWSSIVALSIALAAAGPMLWSLFMQYVKTNPALAYFAYKIDKFGLFSMLVSGRDYYVFDRFTTNIHKFWGPVNWLFGGQDQRKYLIEMDSFDTFLFFGTIGACVYFISLFYSFKDIDKKTKGVFLIGFFSVAFLGGHVFNSALNSLYLAITVIYMSEKRFCQQKSINWNDHHPVSVQET